MRLSKLQKYILEKIYNFRSSLPSDFYDFYRQGAAGKKIIQDTIHKSLDSLVAGEILTAIGKKTARKWFIHRVKLTNFGKKSALEIIRKRQRKLPIK